MKLLTLIVASFAIFSGAAAADVDIIVVCNSPAAVEQARSLVEAAGGKILKEWKATPCVEDAGCS